MSLLASALFAHEKFDYIFQCGEKSKQPNPATAPRGVNSSTNDRATVEKLWTEYPNANIGIDLGRSGLTVWDIDHGLADIAAAREWISKMKLPSTFTVRTGRRDAFGLQLFFQGLTRNHPYSYGSISGEIRSAGYYVLAPGSIHDKSGEEYAILADRPFAAMPALVLELTKERAPRPQGTETKKVPASWRHYYLLERGQELYFAGLTEEMLERAIRWLYEHRCAHDPAKDERIADNEVIVPGSRTTRRNMRSNPATSSS